MFLQNSPIALNIINMEFFKKLFGNKGTTSDNSLGLPEVQKGLELLAAGRFGDLEHLYEQLSPDGKSLILEGIAIPTRNAKQIDTWCAKNPDSYISQLWQGVSFIGRAWEARTAALGKDVSEKRAQMFFDYLEQAYESLRNSLDILDNNPETCARMIRVMMGLSEDKETAFSYFDAAIETDPAHVATHMMMINYLTPKWKGSIEEMKLFAEERLTITGDTMLTVLPLFAMVETEVYLDMSDDPAAKTFFKDDLISKKLLGYYQDFENASIERPYKPLAYNYFSYLFYRCSLIEPFKDSRAKMHGNLTVYPWGYHGVDTVEALMRL